MKTCGTLSDFIIIITYSIIKKTNVFFFFNDINVLFFLYDIIKIWDISMKLFITKKCNGNRHRIYVVFFLLIT